MFIIPNMIATNAVYLQGVLKNERLSSFITASERLMDGGLGREMLGTVLAVDLSILR